MGYHHYLRPRPVTNDPSGLEDSAQEEDPALLHEVANVFAFIAETLRATRLRKPEDENAHRHPDGDGARRRREAERGRNSFYRLALSRLPDNPQVRTLLAGVYLAMANREAGRVRDALQLERYQTYLRQAESELEAALKQWPDYSKALLNLGMVRDLQGRRDEAFALCGAVGYAAAEFLGGLRESDLHVQGNGPRRPGP